MWKTTCLILAASLIFPLLMSSAAPPDEEKSSVSAASGEPPPAGVELPEDLRASLPDARQGRNVVRHEFEVQPRARQRTVCLAGGDEAGDSLCDFGAAAMRMKPCLAAGDCPAADAWEQAMGEMGMRPAPRTMTRAAVRSSGRVERPAPEQD